MIRQASIYKYQNETESNSAKFVASSMGPYLAHATLTPDIAK
jgi:hypothetical protein